MKNIQQLLIDYNKSARSSAPVYIVIHDTGDPGATARNEQTYFSGGDRKASADFFIDSNDIIQIIDTDRFFSWSCGDGRGAYGITNSNSVAIEMCITSDGYPTADTIQNTIDTTKYLMQKYSIDIDHVVRHYDASRKSCPSSFMANNWAKWNEFKQRLISDSKPGTWKMSDNKWWYSYSDGTYPTDWAKIDGKWYLFDASGYMEKGWQYKDSNWYYFWSTGEMATGWVQLNNTFYYLDDSGAMKTGWIKEASEQWYYCDNDGEMIIGWKLIDNMWYYFYSTGQMASNTSIDGYELNEKGQWIK